MPFRDPVQQALSLQRQHLRFSQLQREDAFGRRYMGWLGHYEFGLDHRPFRFAPAPDLNPDGFDYWLDLWTRCYAGVLETLPASALLLDYDRFCAGPERESAALLSLLGLPTRQTETIRAPARREPDKSPDPALLAAAARTHDALRARARPTSAASETE